MRPTIRLELPMDDSSFEEVELPAKWEVCGRCEGAGKHVNPAVDGNGLTQEDFDEDPDFKEDYFRGVYDVECEECRGRTTVLVVDEEAMLRERPELKAAWESHLKWAREDAAERAHERRMRSLGIEY